MRSAITAGDVGKVLLTALLIYPVMVTILFVGRIVRTDLEPFSDAFLIVGPYIGVELAVRWNRNAATERGDRLSRGEAATMLASLKGGDQPMSARWRQGRLHLDSHTLRWRPLFPPRTRSFSCSIDALEVVEVRDPRRRRWSVWANGKVVVCRVGATVFKLAVQPEDVEGLVSTLTR
jgi:hypothetical protein